MIIAFGESRVLRIAVCAEAIGGARAGKGGCSLLVLRRWQARCLTDPAAAKGGTDCGSCGAMTLARKIAAVWLDNSSRGYDGK